jgi:hypothetical protein
MGCETGRHTGSKTMNTYKLVLIVAAAAVAAPTYGISALACKE